MLNYVRDEKLKKTILIAESIITVICAILFCFLPDIFKETKEYPAGFIYVLLMLVVISFDIVAYVIFYNLIRKS